MKFKLWLEAINVPPHLPRQWLDNILSDSQKLESQFQGKKGVFKKCDDIANEYRIDGPQEVYDYLPWELRIFLSTEPSYESEQTLSKRIEEYYNVIENAELSKRYAWDYLLRIDLSKNIKSGRIQEFIDKFSDYFLRDLWKKSPFEKDTSKKRTQFDEDIQELLDSEDEQSVKTFQEAKSILKSLFEYVKLIKKVSKFVEAYKERRDIDASKFYGNEIKFPQSKQYEILYHTTPFASEIESQGFKTKEELGFEALGGATENAISFTADFKIAQAIAVAFRDVINIAHGKFNVGDIIKLAKEEKIDIPDKFKNWIRDMKFRQIRSSSQTLKDMTFDLYKTYLAHTSVRYNPWFFGVRIENFEKMNVNNIGIVAAQVDMKTVKRYLSSMEEFRVPVAGIKNIVKVIRKF